MKKTCKYFSCILTLLFVLNAICMNNQVVYASSDVNVYDKFTSLNQWDISNQYDWIIVNGIACNINCTEESTLTLSQSFHTLDRKTLTLRFDLRTINLDSDEYLAVDVYDGYGWIPLQEWNGTVDWKTVDFNLKDYANSELKIRFRAKKDSPFAFIGIDNLTITDRYGAVPAPASLPNIIAGDHWKNHFIHDVKPFWTTDIAMGENGNFPTYREMDGSIPDPIIHEDGTDRSLRYVRMLSRQTYAYAMGYLLTGDEELLKLSKKGCNWIKNHGKDNVNGGWYMTLNQDGTPANPNEDKDAQNLSYTAMGFGSYYFVTRDEAMENEVLGIRDLMFNKYWDATNERMMDGLDYTLTNEIDLRNDGAYELVAALDNINAYMLIVQPVLRDYTRRNQFLSDMQTLSDSMIKHFYQDGIFWGTSGNKGIYDGKDHNDFGHSLKTYWMMLQLDKRLPDHPYHAFLTEGDNSVNKWVNLAYDDNYGRWAQYPTSQTTHNEDGVSWWVYCEEDQLAATLNLASQDYSSILENTLDNWRTDFVDTVYGNNRGIFDGVQRDGSGHHWPADSTSKAWHWKNAYHETEHALIMYIIGRQMEGKNVELYFAVPESQKETFVAKPYMYEGKEVNREYLNSFEVDGQQLRKVKVTFTDVY